MIRVLAIYPAFDPGLHEMAMVWAQLAAGGAVHCTVLCGAKDTLKGVSASSLEEDRPGLKIHRLPLSNVAALAALGASIDHDLIFCAVAANLQAARAVRARS